jgi:hypothetical protein
MRGVQVRAGRLPHVSDEDWVLVEPNPLPPRRLCIVGLIWANLFT